MAGPGPTREGQSMRQEILTAARALFVQQGYRGLSMSMLARAVGVSKAALYYHFRDKEELFLAVLKELLDELEILINEVSAETSDSRQQIRLLINRIMVWPPAQRAAIRLASQEISRLSPQASQRFQQLYHEKFIGKIQAIIEKGIHAGELRAVDPSLATWALLGMMYPYFYGTHSAESLSPDALSAQLLTIYLDGLEQEDFNREGNPGRRAPG